MPNQSPSVLSGLLDALEREFQTAAARLLAAYQRLLPILQSAMNAVVEDVARLEQAGLPVRPAALRELPSYQALEALIVSEMADFAAAARFAVADLSDAAIPAGIGAAFSLTQAQLPADLIGSAWLTPDPAAVAALTGYVESPAMRAAFAGFGSNAADDFAALLIDLTTAGKSALLIGRAASAWLNVPFGWAENIARTAQLYSYRAAQSASMQANARLLDGWVWWAALDERTCMSCIAQHGSVHPVSETLNDHHRGRCTMLPIVKGTTWADDVTSGQTWFGGLPQGTQRRIAGDLLWTALAQGDAAWSDLSKAYSNDVFGEMLRAASVNELISDPARYFQVGQIARSLPMNGTTVEQAAQIAAEARVP